MDYSKYQKLVFRHFIYSPLPSITIADPKTKKDVGYIRVKLFGLRQDITVYTTNKMNKAVLMINAKSLSSRHMEFRVYNRETKQSLYSIKHKGMISIATRNHWQIVITQTGNVFGELIETSSKASMTRHWLRIIPLVGRYLDIVFTFTPQTFKFAYLDSKANSINAGKLKVSKNMLYVKTTLDYGAAEHRFESDIYIAATSLITMIVSLRQR